MVGQNCQTIGHHHVLGPISLVSRTEVMIKFNFDDILGFMKDEHIS